MYGFFFAFCFPQRIHLAVKCRALRSLSETFTQRNADRLEEALCSDACISAFVTDLTMTARINLIIFRWSVIVHPDFQKRLPKKEDVMCPLARWIHIHNLYRTFPFQLNLDRDSSVGIATCYQLDGPGIESLWEEIFRTCQDLPWGPPSLL